MRLHAFQFVARHSLCRRCSASATHVHTLATASSRAVRSFLSIRTRAKESEHAQWPTQSATRRATQQHRDLQANACRLPGLALPDAGPGRERPPRPPRDAGAFEGASCVVPEAAAQAGSGDETQARHGVEFSGRRGRARRQPSSGGFNKRATRLSATRAPRCPAAPRSKGAARCLLGRTLLERGVPDREAIQLALHNCAASASPPPSPTRFPFPAPPLAVTSSTASGACTCIE